MSAYLNEPGRLNDVVAAIQAMATYKFYKLDFAAWADRITADQARANHWQKIFEEHPEFFRLDGDKKKASLVWRRQYPRRYHVDEDRTLSKAELDTLDEKIRADRISRTPLTSSDISILVQTAIDLHSRALDAKKDMRWWIPLAAAAGGGLLGSIAAALL